MSSTATAATLATTGATTTTGAGPTSRKSGIPEALHRLRATFATGKTHPIEWRLRQLKELARMMRDHEKDFGEALRADLGKCHFEAVLTEMSFVESEATRSTSGSGSSRSACRRR
ncbi:MAG: aldehyde dehydrogenase family protein [Steroidobacteraceae bacterium]|nr:aldehyde dehydrogenase family protein [Steroidobacteraceae bacterium]